jgi:hypothetical protein
MILARILQVVVVEGLQCDQDVALSGLCASRQVDDVGAAVERGYELRRDLALERPRHRT